MDRVKKIVVILFVFLSLQSRSQNAGSYIGLQLGYLNINKYHPRYFGGLELDVQFEYNFGIQWSILGGENYFHSPLGPPAGFVLGLAIANTDTSTERYGLGVTLGLLAALIPESFSYTFPINDQLNLTPFIGPFQLDYIKNKEANDGNWYAGGGCGLRLHLFTINRKLRFSPFGQYKIYYNSPLRHGFSCGVSLSMKIGNN